MIGVDLDIYDCSAACLADETATAGVVGLPCVGKFQTQVVNDLLLQVNILGMGADLVASVEPPDIITFLRDDVWTVERAGEGVVGECARG